MAQFDVYENPILAARTAYPYLVSLQADVARNSPGQIVAPLVPAGAWNRPAGRLTPLVSVRGERFAVLVPELNGIRSADLRARLCSVASDRDELMAAIDYLFFGI